MPRLRLLPFAILPALAAVAIAIPAIASGSSPARAAATCPTFRVLHNDKIGKISLPAGTYAVTVRNMTCASSTTWFARFLEDFDGKLPRPWKATSTGAGNVTFTGGARSFTARRTGASPPTGGRGSLVCSQAYNLRHRDRIGRLVLKKGKYRITRLSTISPRCPKAARLLTRFLEDFDGHLPGDWAVLAQTGTFVNGSINDGFRIKPWVGGGGGNTPDSRKEVRCNVNFHVLHNDRIGPLRFPAGRYSIDVRNLTCPQASSLFTKFLSIPSGRLTGGWKINAATGTIFKGRKSFQPKPNFVVR
jgi:hypothetical protein